MAKTSLSRRDFLKISALGTSSMMLSNCSTLDGYFMGNQKDFKNEVIILGGGAAGLAAANALRKRKVPYRVFEASGRIGGRVQSLHLEKREGAVAELGAEFFESSHLNITTLAKELSLPTFEVKADKSLAPHFFSFQGKSYKVADLIPKIKTLADPLRRVRQDLYHNQDAIITYRNSLQFERAKYYDSLSLQDLFDNWKSEVDPVILALIKTQSMHHFGLDPKDQSALMFLSTLDSEGSALLAGRPVYRMEGGLSRLTQALYRRVAGVIPDHIVKMEHSLIEISEKEDVFKMTFRTPNGKETFTTKNVICTIPFSTLKNVEGIFDLSFSEDKKSMLREITYGNHAKGVLTFDNAFWRKAGKKTAANLGNFTGDFNSQRIWDSGRGQTTDGQGLLSFQLGGSSADKVGSQTTSQVIKDLDLFYPGLSEKSVVDSNMTNWKSRPWSQGSVLAYRPGQFARFHGVAGESAYGGRFLFAGEHTSLRGSGTLEGALESGDLAGRSIII